MMEDLQEVKRCPNPECPEKYRVYLNGKTHCEVCNTPLVKSRVRMTLSSMSLIQSMAEVRTEVKTLMNKKRGNGRG